MTDRDPEPGKSAQPKSRGPLGKLLLLAIVLLVLLVAFVALLPTILSTDGFRNTLVDGANESLGGAIEIDGLHFSWGGEQRIEGLRLWPEAVGRGEPLLSLPSAGFEMDIMALITSGPDVRAAIEGFDARLVVHADGTTSLEDFLGVAMGSAEPEAPGEPAPRGEPLEIDAPAVKADIALRGGRALLVDEASGLTTGVENLAITLTSESFDAPLVLHVTADLRVGENRSPFELTARGLGRDDDGWSVSFATSGLQPGALTTPLVAAAFPLLSAGGGDEPFSIAAPLDLSGDIGGASLEAALNGDLSALTGSLGLTLGDGQITGGVLGNLQSSLSGLGGGGGGILDALGKAAGDKAGGLGALSGLDLSFHGFSGTLELADGKASIADALWTGADGQARPLPIEGHMQLGTGLDDSTLHYRIPWAALVPSKSAADLLKGQYLTLSGPLGAPTFDLGLDDVVQDAAQSKLDQALEEKLGGNPLKDGKLDVGGLLDQALKKKQDKDEQDG